MEKHTINYNGQNIPFMIQRKKVKNVNLRVYHDASVVVSAHGGVPYEYIESFVYKKAPWILKKIKSFDQKRYLNQGREYDDGEKIQYLGRAYRLIVCSALDRETASLERDQIHLYVTDVNNSARKEKFLEAWYKDRAGVVFQDSLDRMLNLYNRYFELEKPRLTIRTMKTRWGSCSWNKKKITLNTRLMEFPPECIDYVVMHELIHFKYQRHDSDFYQFLASMMPDWQARRIMLKQRY